MPDSESIEYKINNFVIIIGSMKSGTSTLFSYLSQHPEICRSVNKEPSFFATNKKYVQGYSSYEKQWPKFNPAIHRYALEASTNYTKAPYFKGVSRRISRFDGDFKYIYIVRNPVDRVESHLAHNIAKGRGNLGASLRQSVDHAIQVSSYAQQLDVFRAELADPKCLILDFDELRRTPLTVVKHCARFLELEPSFEFREIKPRNVRRSTNGADEFRLDAEQRADIARRLRSDILNFRDRYGFDVSGWGLV